MNNEKPDKPSWVKVRYRMSKETLDTESYLIKNSINTVCSSALCPNRDECFHERSMTFLLLGPSCTRNCSFCSVDKSCKEPYVSFTEDEEKIIQAVKKYNLEYVTLTSPTRDDLPDGGAEVFAKIIMRLKKMENPPHVEALIPDFAGDFSALETVLDSKPDVIAHNLETIPRLYYRVRKGADWARSLEILGRSARRKTSIVKTAFMVGLGETYDEIIEVLKAVRDKGTDIVIIGQYLRPTENQTPVDRYVSPEELGRIETEGREMGFKVIMAGTFYRSSYKAAKAYQMALQA